jgi:hypothetical protein
MEISVPLNNVNPQFIFFAEKKNNIIVSGDFIKLIYSTADFEMSGLYVVFGLNKHVLTPRHRIPHSISTPDCLVHMRSIETDAPLKYTVSFDPYLDNNYHVIQKLCSLEYHIIERYMVGKPRAKIASYMLKTQLMSGNIKCHSETKRQKLRNNIPGELNGIEQIILKISGIWETDTNVGITMKFIVLRDAN